jgi:hypothetical protein
LQRKKEGGGGGPEIARPGEFDDNDHTSFEVTESGELQRVDS